MDAVAARPYRLGLDLGTNSLGWFTTELEWDKGLKRWVPRAIGTGGVRIFPDGRDPQSKTSNAVDRRDARSARRRRDRFVQRRDALMNALVRFGLMPADKAARKALETLDPYQLRTTALDGALPLHHVGRALFHLNQRRGFLSNRKANKKEAEDGAIKLASSRLKAAMDEEKARTLGEFFWARHQKRDGVRARATITGTKASYDFYPTRDLVQAEFDAIWEKQAPHHPAMTDAARAEIARIIFHQRPLKPVPVGKCSLDPATEPFATDPEGYRAPWAHPLVQRFRILQEARNLGIRETGKGARRLTKEQSDVVVKALLGSKTVSFDRLRTLLKLPDEAKFSHESEKRKGLDGDEVAARLSHQNAFGKMWRGLSRDRQIEIVDRLLNTEGEVEMVKWLMSECGLSLEAATRVANTNLPDSHSRFGLRAIRKVVPILEHDLDKDGVSGINLHDAIVKSGYQPKQATGEILDSLPYYGEWLPDDVVGTGDPLDPPEKRYGRFPNPTVHIGLGQLRRVVNQLIDTRGAPTEIVIEFTRELKLSPKERSEKQREQAENQERNEARRKLIRKELGRPDYDPTPTDLLKMRLWEELGAGDGLDRKCPYTGDGISVTRLLSNAVDIDHILPFSMTLDDSPANKTVCMHYANEAKGNSTPYEAFGRSPMISGKAYDWTAISARAALLPKNKRWRFDPKAREEFEEKGGFEGRQLNETGWLAKLAKQYLGAVTDPYQIWVVPGRLTSMIRGKWGLNSLLPDHNYGGVKSRDEKFAATLNGMEFSGVKNRADHRHHAIDAFVMALTDRSLVQRIASANESEREKIDIPTPWDKEKLRTDLEAVLKRMVVSHKPDHGVQGQLHEDTAYGLVKNPDKEDGKFFVRRKPIENLSAKEVGNIRDVRLREMVQKHVAAEKAKGRDVKAALASFAEAHEGHPHIREGLRRVRVLVPEDPAYTVAVKDARDGRPYKAYAAGENLFVDICEDARGRWRGKAVTRFQANHARGVIAPEIPEGGRHVMRVFKNDLIALDLKGVRTVMVVRQLEASAGRFKLAPHNETGNLQARHDTDNEIDPFRWLMASYSTLKAANAEAVRVDELGRVWRKTLPGGQARAGEDAAPATARAAAGASTEALTTS